MNSLIYNPNVSHVQEWNAVYLSQHTITPFENIIERTCNYLSVISKVKIKKLASMISINQNADAQPPKKKKLGRLTRKISIREQGGIQRLTDQINELRSKLEQQYNQILGKQNSFSENNPIQISEIHELQSKTIKGKMEVCENHLRQLKTKAMSFYDQFIEQECELLQSFVRFKLSELEQKLQKVRNFMKYKELLKEQPNIRIIFDNIYIETDYLRVLVHKNVTIFEMHSQNEHSAEEPQVITMRKREFKRLKKCQEEVQNLKRNIRELYIQNYSMKKSKVIKDHFKLQNFIKNEIAVNKTDFEAQGSFTMWLHGFIFAILIFALCGIIIFRETNIAELELKKDYEAQFQVWRGASYLISFNWVLAFVTYLYSKLGINYRMILLQENRYLERSSSFFKSASLLSAVYLVLFLVYLLHELGYIVGYDHIKYLGYYMWGANMAFMLNPFKVLNYHSRIYFMDVLFKNLKLLFRPINFNLFLLGMIMGSCAQPLNDFAFTACQLIYDDLLRCSEQGRFATFIYLLIYLFYRIIQSFRLHYQYSATVCVSRARQGLTAVLFSINTVVSSYLYGTYKTQPLLNYWIVSATFSTIIGTNADLRADWGIISFDKEDCLLRRHKMFQRWVYFLCAGLDLLLNIAWALTISTAVSQYLNINILYFFLLLQNIEFCRRGMWMIFRIQDDHMQNVGSLNAMADDLPLRTQIDQTIKKVATHKSQVSMEASFAQMKQTNTKIAPQNVPCQNVENKQQNNAQSQEISAPSLTQIQALVTQKQKESIKINKFVQSTEWYLNIISKLYKQSELQYDY